MDVLVGGDPTRDIFIFQRKWMSSRYPFGQLGETLTEENTINVVKTLHFQSPEELEMIQHMIHFLKAAKHDNLVNVEKVIESQNKVQLFYQYVPLQMGKWLAEINEELVQLLQEQMLELAQYLCRSSIKFTFEPESVGVSEGMTIKYFLNEFSIDLDNTKKNLEEVRRDVLSFFQEFFNLKNREKEETPKDRTQSLSTSGSLSHAQADKITESVPNRQSAPSKSIKSAVLSSRIENSKKKCLEVIKRYKKMKIKQ